MSSHHSLLIVDDEPHVLKSLNRLLACDRFVIRTAESAEDALVSIRREPPSVLLTDQLMPGRNGTALLSEVAGLYPDVVGILMSGHADFDSLTEALNDGQIYKFLMKPWDNDLLKRCIHDLFTQIELSEEGLRVQRELKAEKSALERHLELARRNTLGRAYNRYEHLFNELPVAVVMVDTDGDILDYNASFAGLTEVRYSLIGQSVEPWLPSAVRRQLIETGMDTPLGTTIAGEHFRVTGCSLQHGETRQFAFAVVPL